MQEFELSNKMTHATKPKTPQRKLPLTGIGWLDVGEDERKLVNEVIDRGLLNRYYAQDPQAPPLMAQTLEKEFREKMGRRYALAVTSGTAALAVALDAMRIGPGDEVIVPVYSWISCATAVLRCGATPVFADMDDSLSMAASEIDRLATPRTKLVIVVHFQGVASDMDAILAAARRHGLKVLEDCASSCGASFHGKRVGSMGDIGTYSFQTNKVMTSGEGGMVIMDDPAIYERAVRAHDLGLVRPYHAAQLDALSELGFAGSQNRVTELNSAVALAQLRKLDRYIARCRAMTARIWERVGKPAGLTFRHIPDPRGDLGIESYFWPEKLETTLALREAIKSRGVDCEKRTGTYSHCMRDYISQRATAHPGLNALAAFKDWPAPGYRAEDFPHINNLADRMLALPMSIRFTDDDVEYIADSLIEAFNEVL